MTDSGKEPSDAFKYARPGSRLERVMRERGSYIPQDLIYDFEESLRLICIQSGSQEGELREVKVVPGSPQDGFPYSLEIWQRNVNKEMPAPLEPLDRELSAHIAGRTDVKVVKSAYYTRISGSNFTDILHVLNDGFIKPHDPEANIDVEGKMNPSWVERSSQTEGQGGGVGSPG